ncbi:NUDIX hydrolase [Streptomyces sp. TE33382]
MNKYDALRAARPEWFRNTPGGIDIETSPEAVARAGGVIYQDTRRIVLCDAVTFPGGTPGTYLRTMSASPQPGAAVLPVLPDGTVVLVEHFRHATRSWHLEAPRGFGAAGLTSTDTAAKELGEEIGAHAPELLALGRVHPDTGALGDEVRLFAALITSVGALATAEGIRKAIALTFEEAEEMVRDGQITDGLTIALLYRARLHGLASPAARLYTASKPAGRHRAVAGV